MATGSGGRRMDILNASSRSPLSQPDHLPEVLRLAEAVAYLATVDARACTACDPIWASELSSSMTASSRRSLQYIAFRSAHRA